MTVFQPYKHKSFFILLQESVNEKEEEEEEVCFLCL